MLKISMAILFRVVILVNFFLLTSCIYKASSKKEKSQPPSWISSRPSDNIYWYGIGLADPDVKDVNQVARQRAISEIAEQIKVNIQSELIDLVEGNNNFVQEFSRSVIQTRVDANLEFIEYLESFRTSDSYYILVRLDKEQYFAKLKAEKHRAENIASDLVHSKSQNLSINYLSNLVSAIEIVMPFLDQSLMMEYPIGSGESVEIYRVATQLLRNFNHRIELKFEPEILNFKLLLDQEKNIDVTALDKNTGSRISGINIIVSNTEKSNTEEIVTDKNGEISYKFKIGSFNSGDHGIIFSIDYSSMFNSKVLDLIQLVPKNFSINVNYISPKIILSENITNLNEKVHYKPISGKIKNCFDHIYSANFVKKIENADLQLTLKIITEQRRKRLGEEYPYIIFATGFLSLYDAKTKDEISSISLGEYKGADFDSPKLAGMDAIYKMEKNMILSFCQ